MREAIRAIGPANVRPIVLQISSDPSLTLRDRSRLEQEASLCERSGTADNFLPFEYGKSQGFLRWKPHDEGGLLFGRFFNEFTAPFAGIMASRVAHGTLSSQQLAYAICTMRLPQPAGGRKRSDEPTVSAEQGPPGAVSYPAPETETAQPDTRPEYAHLAMCDGEEDTDPPLGWVLSRRMRDKVPDILEECGNAAELKRITDAFPEKKQNEVTAARQ